ncbi:HYR-like domain-containing protein, partial [Flavobacterium suncheonense]|uniref:HYR-like domain-containing protein n=1 Tax=Flavobacterium suncheonense TaxID=350894 RepID=UPI003FA3CC61
NCGGSVTGVPNDVVTPGSCPNSYVIVRTWTFTDSCGNSSTASQTITVNDDIPPVAPAAPADVTVACSGLVPAMISLTATDNCNGSITVSGVDSITSGNCASSYTITRIWTFTDGCGNTSSVSQTINVADTSSPVLPQAPADVTVACSADVPAMISLTATDTCAGPITSVGVDTITPGSCPNSYVITRTWTFGDLCGNTSSVSQTITVNDNIAPVAPAAPANVTVSCSAEVPAMISLTANDNCQGEITVQGTDSITPGDCINSFVVVRTWTFVDACGNTSSVSQTITVDDNVAPVPPSPPVKLEISCSSEVPAMISLTAIDNCSGPITVPGVDSIAPGDCPNSFVITRTWTFTDACGNTAVTSQLIEVEDTIAPVVPEAPADVTAACGTEIPAMISLTATDNCQGDITAEGVDTITPGQCVNSYVITRTWTFVDACGNTSSVSQTINVNDTIAPVIPEAPADVTVACGTEIPAMISLTATDNCQDPITVEGVDAITPGACANSYIVTRTWTFVDACGNTSSVSQTINVNDTIAPVIPEAPADVTVACGTEIPAMISLTATDNCQDPITVEGVDAITPGACANSYVVTRTWTFVDACGNTSSVSQTINVNDTIAPVVPEAPADVTVACGSEVPAMITLTATDNCQDPITVEGVDAITPGDCPNSYVVTRTWTFVDACGNTSSVSQTINVSDTIAPELPPAPVDITVSCSGDVPPSIWLTATDNCGVEITVLGEDSSTSIAEGACVNSYIITRTWTFTDACGNTSSIAQIITVHDEIAPILEDEDFQSEMTVTCTNIPDMPELNFTDNCGGSVTVESSQEIANEVQDENNLIISYDIIRTWTATDTCGNSTVITQTIHVTVGDTFNAGTKELCSNDSANASYNLNQLLTDLVSEDELDGTWTIENAGFESALQGSILNVTALPVGYYTLVYNLDTNDSFCPRKYEFYLHVLDDCGVLAECSINVFNAVSPNHDGLNDIFYIDGITCYAENNVKIYNRWGILVYDENGYNNADISFNGVSEGRSTLNRGEELPDGTYFYILKYKSNETGNWLDKSGYLYLNR